MLKSMTGYGKSTGGPEGNKFSIEIRTLNSKQLDINLRSSKIFREKEAEIRLALIKGLERGKIDIQISFESKEDSSEITLNKNLLAKYYHELKTISQELKNDFPTDFFALALHLPDVLSSSN